MVGGLGECLIQGFEDRKCMSLRMKEKTNPLSSINCAISRSSYGLVESACMSAVVPERSVPSTGTLISFASHSATAI